MKNNKCVMTTILDIANRKADGFYVDKYKWSSDSFRRAARRYAKKGWLKAEMHNKQGVWYKITADGQKKLEQLQNPRRTNHE